MTLLMGGEAMRRNPKKGGQFAIIWVDLLYEDSVPATAKILFGEIYRLSGPDGWCDASNQDFMDLLGCSETTVRNLLKALEDVGQIRVVILSGSGITPMRRCNVLSVQTSSARNTATSSAIDGQGSKEKTGERSGHHFRIVLSEPAAAGMINQGRQAIIQPKGDPGRRPCAA